MIYIRERFIFIVLFQLLETKLRKEMRDARNEYQLQPQFEADDEEQPYDSEEEDYNEDDDTYYYEGNEPKHHSDSHKLS